MISANIDHKQWHYFVACNPYFAIYQIQISALKRSTENLLAWTSLNCTLFAKFQGHYWIKIKCILPLYTSLRYTWEGVVSFFFFVGMWTTMEHLKQLYLLKKLSNQWLILGGKCYRIKNRNKDGHFFDMAINLSIQFAQQFIVNFQSLETRPKLTLFVAFYKILDKVERPTVEY